MTFSTYYKKMEKIKTSIKERKKEYEIIISDKKEIFSELKKFIKKNHKDKKIALITDDNIKSIYEKEIKKELNELNYFIISVPSGEKSKSRETKEDIENKLFSEKFGRDTLLIALGGGVVGDLTGFIASTFNRGVPFIQIPTSLLAMIDSSIGGKTAVNTKFGKNLIGSFYQPEAVFIDLGYINTLPKEEFLNGMSELIKHSIILDKELFKLIEEKTEEIIKKEKNILKKIIKRSIEIKKQIVEIDEKEKGIRQILNFGHTVAHALETASCCKIKHGFAVSMGIAAEITISEKKGILSKEEKEKIISLLKKISLPVKIDKNYDTKELIKIMSLDKKSIASKPRFILIEKIGKTKEKNNCYSFEVEESIIKSAIEKTKRD